MQRMFLQDVGRYKAGEIRDYPQGIWTDIARSAGQALDRFTKPVTQVAKEAVATTKRK